MKSLADQYKNEGYFIAKVPQLIPLLSELRNEIYEIFSTISEGSNGKEISDDNGVINFRVANQQKQFLAFKHTCNSPKLFAVGGHSTLLELLYSAGFKRPVYELQPLLRCDMPIEDQSIFKQHQDYPYNIGSENSATIWIPLQDTVKETGALLVAPRTHLNGIYPNKDGVVNDEYKFNFETCPIKLGEVLVFNQKMVHESGRNISNKIRFSIQLRFSDLGCSVYADRGYPINHKITTESYAKGNLI